MCFKIFYFGWVTHEKCTRDILTNLSGQFTAWSEEVWSVSFYSFQFAPYTRWPPSYPTQLYIEQPSGNLAEGSEICACKEGGELVCAFLEQVQSRPCNTDNIYYRSVLGQVYYVPLAICCMSCSHASPFYLAHRGGCICYSGDFICAKEDFTKAFKRGEVPVGGVTILLL